MHLLTIVTESHSLFGKNMHAISTMNVAVWICRTMNTDCTLISHIYTDYREVPSSPTKVIPIWRKFMYFFTTSYKVIGRYSCED